MVDNNDTTILKVSGLKIVYKTDLETVYAVNGINFSLKRGETLGIVGETGAGKTTTALAIMGLLPERIGVINAGSILFGENEIIGASKETMRSIRGEKIAMIFQDPMTSLNPVLTIGNQIGEAIALHSPTKSKDEINERVDEVLSLVGISPVRKNDYPHQFSGGMKQRVIIAIALSCEPDLIIADEPTTALDVTIQAQVLKMIRSLRDRLGTSMIMITHDLGVVAQTCDNVAVMYAGELIEYGTADDVFNADKHHPYTTGLFGSIPNMKVKTKRLLPIAGLMPDPTSLPAGCNFAPRCPFCKDVCRECSPEDYFEGTHRIGCHLFSNTEARKDD